MDSATLSHAQRRTIAEGTSDPRTGAYVATQPQGMAEMAKAKDLANEALMNDPNFRVAYEAPWYWPFGQSAWNGLVNSWAKTFYGMTKEELAVDMAESMQPYTEGAKAEAESRRGAMEATVAQEQFWKNVFANWPLYLLLGGGLLMAGYLWKK